jgi:serine protease AprX
MGSNVTEGLFDPSIPADPERGGSFRPEQLDRSVIAIPLLQQMKVTPETNAISVVIDLNLQFPRDRNESGLDAAARRVRRLLDDLAKDAPGLPSTLGPQRFGSRYLLAKLSPALIRRLVDADQQAAGGRRAIFRVWPDFEVTSQLDASVATVKADAARASFSATGADMVWAVLDSGVQADHPHFKLHRNCLDLPAGIDHVNFIDGQVPATVDPFGHGTHVAGIIAGEGRAARGKSLAAARAQRDSTDNSVAQPVRISKITGVAPECKIVSYKVLNDNGSGNSGAILEALNAVHEVNNHGQLLRIHGVNISAGYPFKPEWFACGQSPICVEVDRLVRSGVVVVVAAGNTGYAYSQDGISSAQIPAGRAMTINDPGNAQLAITVGSTHRDSPHIYGVSYFSSKGPTGDGRAKPDLLAPGERILSAAAGKLQARGSGDGLAMDYVESSGTSMAAPHVSGAIAAFLSVRREFIGRPEQIKQIFTATATDLGRVRDFQGAGLVDLMRAIQYV